MITVRPGDSAGVLKHNLEKIARANVTNCPLLVLAKRDGKLTVGEDVKALALKHGAIYKEFNVRDLRVGNSMYSTLLSLNRREEKRETEQLS